MVFLGPHVTIFVTVAVHMLSTLILPLPLLLVAVFSQMEGAKYKLPHESVFESGELLSGPLPKTFTYEVAEGLEWQNAAIISAVTVFYVLGWLELLQFYLFETGRESLLGDTERQKTFLSSLITGLYTVCVRAPFHLLTLLFVVFTLAYAGLLLVWALLGAVVNPYKYLPYAAGAGTLVFATFHRYSKLHKLREQATKRIHAQIQTKLERQLEQRVRAYRSDIAEKAVDNVDDTERFLDRRSKAEFFKLVEATGLDRTAVNIQGLANGTNAAVNTIAAQLGVEPTIAMIIVSLARKNSDQLLDAAQELGPKLGLDGSLARSLMNLANSWSKESGRQGIKLFINTVASAAERNVFFNLDKALESPFTDASDPAIDLTMGIMPELAASMLAITEDNDFDPLVELLNSEKVVRDAFRPVPMQVFSLMHHVFVQDREGVRSSLIRIIERLLISDSCSLQMTPGGKAIPISKFVEHLAHKLGTDSQLAAVLAKLAVMTPETSSSTGLQPKANRQTQGINLSSRDKAMIKVLKGAWKPLNRDGIRRPVQSTKRWLRSKIVAPDGTLIVGSDGTMSQDTQNFVLVYQVLCLVDGISAIWMQKPDDLLTCQHFCREILSLDPAIAGAILALINTEEGGVNPADDSNSAQTMRSRIIAPLTKQLSLDVGSKAIPGVVTTSPALMEPQISQMLSACFALSRGRRIDFTQLAVLAGLQRETANYVGPLLNGKIKAPLWKQVTPLCNTLGISDSGIIIALMQLRRQAAMGDYEISLEALLPWLGVLPRAMRTFRWLVQLAVAQRPAHIQRALVSVFGFARSAETRKFSMIMARRRRLNVPSESIWYESESVETCDPRDQETIRQELTDSSLDEMNDWIADQMDSIPPERIRLLWYLTRHYESQSNEFDITDAKREFFLFVGEQHPNDPVEEAVTSKVFDFISFFMTYGEDTPSTKSMALIFKIKIDLLKAVMQLPMYAADMPVRTLRRPRSSERIEKGVDILKDYLRVPAEIAYKYNEILSRARVDVATNDEALFDTCIQLDRFKAQHEPRCWEFFQALTLPSDEAFNEFTSRVMYAMLHLERDVPDSADFLRCAKIDISTMRTAAARNSKWFEVRQALRGVLGMCTSNMAQIVAFLHSAAWIKPEKTHGLMLKLAVSTTSGNASHLAEHLRLFTGDATTHRVLFNLTDTLTHNLNFDESHREAYALAFEAMCVLSMFRRSGDPQGQLRLLFAKSLRMTAECLEIHPALITALLSASTGDKATFGVALLKLAQDEGGLSPVVAGGLCSIGSGDVKGVEEVAELLDLDPGVCEGLVALASGTPTTTRGCLPGLLASLEVDIDLGQGVLGLCNDDSTSIESLATALTLDRPNMEQSVFNTLACLPGLRSANQARILAALDGLSSSSKLTVRNMNETAMAISLINTNTYAVREAYGMLKLDLDLACLGATLFKFTAVPFATCPEAYESPAHLWRSQMPGNYEHDAHGSGEQLGAESLFASICSSKLPKLFQRLCLPLGMVSDLPESQLRVEHEKANPQHVARPWNLRQTGHFLSAIFYSGITGRFSRLMEVMDLPFDRKGTLQDFFEAEGGFIEVMSWFSTEDEFDSVLLKTEMPDAARKKRPSNFVGVDPRKALVAHLLQLVMAVPPQLANPNMHPPKSNAHKTYAELQTYLKKKLSFDAKKTLKFILLVYRLGAMNMSPPTVVSRHTSQKSVDLILRWADYDDANKVYKIERPSKASTRSRTYMTNIDWDRCSSADTYSQWQAFFLLTAQLSANVLMTYDDSRANPEYDLVADLSSGPAADKCTQALRFRSIAKGKSQDQKGDANLDDHPFGALERRQIPVKSLKQSVESLEGPADRPSNRLRAKAREARIDRIYRILQVADNITGSAIDAFGDDVGGMVLGMMWNDQEKTGHWGHMVHAFRLLHLPSIYGPALLAITAREKSHPLLLPRFESTFFPQEAGLCPNDPEYRCEGHGFLGEEPGRPPKIRTDAAGIPAFRMRVPPAVAALFKELRVPAPHGQREALYHLLRIAMGDRAFLNLNKLSASTKLNVPAQLCFGLCAGAYLQGADPFSRPDLTRIVRSLERISSDLGVNEHLAGLVVCAAAGNVDSLRQLGIALSTGAQPGHQHQQTNLELVSKEGLVRALCGVVTGEVAGELLRPCRISADGNRWNSNIDMLCNKLLSSVIDQGKTLRDHANYLRCVAGLGLADPSLLLARRTPLYEGAHLFRLLPVDPNSGNREQPTLLERAGREQSIVEKFERAIMKSETKKYRSFFEGFLQLRSRPDKLNKMLHAGTTTILQKDSWLSYVVSPALWDGGDIPPEARSTISEQANPSGYETTLATRGPFSFLLFQMLKSFAGNSVSTKKRHGLVPLMEYLRSDGKSRHTLPTMDTNDGQLMSSWCLFQQMADDKLGRSAIRSEIELRSFGNVLGSCFNGGVAAVSPPTLADGAKLERSDVGVVPSHLVKTTGSGIGCSIEITLAGKYTIRKAGAGYVAGDQLDFTLGTRHHSLSVTTKSSSFGLTKAAIECMLHVVTGNWNSMHGIEPDLVTGQLEVDPPRAVRTIVTRGPRLTPGWKLLRATNDRELPQLVVGGGRRPLLALRRLRAFIKLGSGTVSRVSPEFFSNQLPTKQATLSTEIFALLEGSAVSAAYKIAVLSIIFILENDVNSLSGVWSSAPILFSSVVQQLVKPSIDTSSADGVSKRSMLAAKRAATQSRWKKAVLVQAASSKSLQKVGLSAISNAASNKTTIDNGTDVLWGMVAEMIEFVKHEFEFHIPNRSDLTSQARRERLSSLFGQLPKLATMVDGFGSRPDITTRSVLESAFAFVSMKGSSILSSMLGSGAKAKYADAAQRIVGALMGRGGETSLPREQFDTILSNSIEILSVQSTEPTMVAALKEVAATFRNLRDSELGARHTSFPAAAPVGKLLSGLNLQEDAPGLAILDSPPFWEKVYGLFLKLRDPPQSNVSENERLQWRADMVDTLCQLCGLTVEGGLLNEVVKSLEDDKATDIFDKFKRISTLRTICATQQGLMSVRERTTWYKEFARQVLVGRFGAQTAGTRGSAKSAADAVPSAADSGGEHWLLGCAMFLFDLWSWVPDATDGKQLQQSMFRLRVLLKDAVQLAVELTASSAKKASPLKRRAEQKRRIALACSLVDAAFEIPRSIAGPCEEAWIEGTKDVSAHWAPVLVIDWERLAARILAPASMVLSTIERFSKKNGTRQVSSAMVVETLRVLRDCKNTYGAVLDLTIAIDAVPNADDDDQTRTAESAHPEISSLVTLDTTAVNSSVSGDQPRLNDNDDDEIPAVKLDLILDVIVCLAKYLKNNRIIVPWKAKALVDFSSCILGPGVDLHALSFRGSACAFLQSVYDLLKLEGGVATPGHQGTLLWKYVLTNAEAGQRWENIWPVLKQLDGFDQENMTESKKELYAYAGISDLNADVMVALAIKFFPVIDPQLKVLLNKIMIGKRMKLDTLLGFFSHPLIALLPAKQVGTEALLRKACETEAVAMVASTPQISIAMEISEAHVDSKPTLRMVANAVDKIARYALSVDKSPEALQHMLEEMVGDMLPKIVRPHVTLPIIDSLNGRQGLVTLARSHIGAAAKITRITEMTKQLALTIGTKVYGVNEFIARRAVDVLAGCSKIQANMTHVRKLDSLANERDLLEEAAGGVIRTGRLNGIRTTTSEYMLSVMRAIYRARWLENRANFEHFVLELDNNSRCKGSVSARAKILLMDCRGAISSFHSALLRRVIEFASVGAAWKKIPVSADGGGGGGGGGAAANPPTEITGTFQCPTCREVSTVLQPLFGVDKTCCICHELEVDCAFKSCRHVVACKRCMLQMQDTATAAMQEDADHVFRRDFLWDIDPSISAKGFVNPTGVHRQLGNIYERMCKLIHPAVQLAALAPWPKWSEISARLSHDRSDFEALRGQPAINPDTGELLDGGGIVRTVQEMTEGLSPKLAHLTRPLTMLVLMTISGQKLDRTVLYTVLNGIAQVRVIAGTTILKGPTPQQVDSLTEDISARDGTWPVFGTAEGLSSFIMSNSMLQEQARVVFTERAKPEEIVALANDSLIKCLQGVHTGRDYATNLIFPVVRLMHYRYGAYGNISILPNLTIRKLIAAEIAKKEADKAMADGSVDGDSNADVDGSDPTDEEILEERQLKKIGTFPVFDLFGNNKKRAEDLIMAVKASLFRKHTNELKQTNADRLGAFMVSVVRLHQQLVTSINFAANEDDDIRRLAEMFVAASPGTTPLLDQPLMAGFELVSEMTVDHPKRMVIALIKVCKYLTEPKESFGIWNQKEVPHLKQVLSDYIKINPDHPPVRTGTRTEHGVEHETWNVSLVTSVALSQVLGEPVEVSTVVDVSGDDSSADRREWVASSGFESVALVRAWSKMLCTLLNRLWLKECTVDAAVDSRSSPIPSREGKAAVSAEDALKQVVSGLFKRVACARQIVWMLVLESSNTEIESFDTAYEGLRVKRILVAYYRSILLYLWWYVDMRKHKFPWLSKMLYDLPTDVRSSDEAFPLYIRGPGSTPEGCFFGQFGILQFVRRVDYVVFNCRSSGLQRTEMTSLTQRLFELQRAFDVDLSEGRRPEAPEAIRKSLAERVELADCFAINILYTVGPFRPLVDCIYLNRRLLTGTGLQSPVAFQERYEHLAREQVSGYLRLVQRVNPLLRPPVDGQVVEQVKQKKAEGDNVSMSGSLMEDFGAADGLSVIFASNRRGNGEKGGDTASVGSKASAGSMRSQAGESSEAVVKRHPVMTFIPIASKLFIALARASQGVFTWDLFEKIARTLVMESVMEVAGCDLESPFSNLPLQHQLRKILECTLEMASAESSGGESRESALKLSGMMGRLLGLENHLVDGMLAVVDKSPQARQVALTNLGAFLAKSISAGDSAGAAGGGGANSGGSAVGGGSAKKEDGGTKGDSTMQISATISGLVALASNDFEGARQMAIKLGGFEVSKIERLFAFCSAMYKAGLRGEEIDTRFAQDPVAMVEGQLTDEKLYIAFDTDGDASMDYEEFETCTKYLTFPNRLTTITAMRLFTRADRNKENGLSLHDYKLAMVEFSDEIANKVLAKRGLSIEDNRWTLFSDTLKLFLIFIFIFVGIVAFTSTGGFESTVNSFLPVAAGVGITIGSDQEEVTDQDDQELLDDIDEALAELTENE